MVNMPSSPLHGPTTRRKPAKMAILNSAMMRWRSLVKWLHIVCIDVQVIMIDIALVVGLAVYLVNQFNGRKWL